MLEVVEAGVEAVLGEEFGVVAGFADAALVQHIDAVHIADGGEAVGDDQAGLALHEHMDAVLHQRLGGAVYGTGGFVQHQNVCAVSKRAGEREQLLLPR